MKNTLVITTDLGNFKAFKFDKTPEQNTPRLLPLEDFELVDAHGRLQEKVTDQGGRYRVPTAAMAMSYGEREKLDLELRKRLMRRLAEKINELLLDPAVDSCWFACSKEINPQMLGMLDPAARAKIEQNLPQDLTKLKKADILDHFSVHA